MASRDLAATSGAPDRAPAPSTPDLGVAERRYLPKVWGEPPTPLAAGVTYSAWHPFKRDEYAPIPDEGPESGGVYDWTARESTWVPGWLFEPCGRYGEDVQEVWDGEGLQLRTIVSLHKPGPKYPERVFYVRQWQAPCGRRFGKAGLRCVIAPTFRHWLRGERWPSYSPAREAHIRWVQHALGNTPDAAKTGRDPSSTPDAELGPGMNPNPIQDELEARSGGKP